MMYAALAAGAIILVLGLSLKVQTSRLNAVRAEYTTFKAQVAVLGEQAKLAAQKREADDKRAKEKADVENKRTTDNLRADIKRLRSARAGGGLLPPAPAGSSSPNLASFDREELERAVRAFDAGIQGLVDEGSEATVNLNTARVWAQESR